MTCEDARLNKEVPGPVRKEVYILSISNFFSDLGSGMLITLVPLYIIGLKSSLLDMPLMMKAGLAASIFGLAMVAFQPITGRLLDRLDRRKPFILIGFFLYFLLALLHARTSSFEELLVVRFFHGMAVAVIFPAIITMVIHLSTEGTRGKTLGVYSTIRGLGFGFGPLVGGAAATYLGFQAAFYICAILGLASFLLVSRFVRETKGEETQKDDSIGDKKDVKILILAFAMFLTMLGLMMIAALLPEYEVRLNASEFLLGVAVSAFMLTRLVFQIPFGTLSDRIGQKKMIIAGMLLSAPLNLALAYVPDAGSLIAIRALQGIGVAMIDTPAMALASKISGGKNVGKNMGTITAAYGAGMTVGPLFGGSFAGYLGFEVPFYVTGLLMVLAAVLVWKKI